MPALWLSRSGKRTTARRCPSNVRGRYGTCHRDSSRAATMTWTTTEPTVDAREVATTIAATACSTLLYLRKGDPYLARGVVGDLFGFAVLSTVLLSHRKRARHEALVCLAGITAVRVAAPTWPLARPPRFWWSAMAAGLASYLALRRRFLAPSSAR